MPCHTELIDQFEREWSEPVQVKIENGNMVFRRPEPGE